MTLKDQMAADVAVFLNTNELAEVGQHNGKSIKIVVIIGETNVNGNIISNEGQSDRAVIWVSAVDIPSPQTGLKIIDASGITWRMERLNESAGGMHALACIRTSTHSAFGGK